MSELVSVFNVTDSTIAWPVGVSPLVPDGVTDNSPNLNAMIAALLDPGGITLGKGGVLEFPAAGTASYAFEETINIGPVMGTNYPSNIILRGTGAQSRGTPLLQMLVSSEDFFVIDHVMSMDPTTSDNIAGIVFQDMIISFAFSDGQPGGGRGITVAHGNVRLQRITLDEVPDAAVHFVRTLHCSIIDCDIRVKQVMGATGIRLGDTNAVHSAIETYITGTTIADYGTEGGGTGMAIYGAEHLRMVNCRIEGWANGIIIEPNTETDPTRKLFFGNVSCFSHEAGVQIIPTGAEDSAVVYVAEVWFAECEIGPAGGITTVYSGGGIVIGPTDGTTTIIDQIRFVDCYSSLWAGPGMDIQGGTNVEILGGYYSCNGNNGGGTGPEPYSKSGIAVSGDCKGLRISNAACNNSVWDVYRPAGPAGLTQDYGIYVGGGSSSVRLHGCDLTGNNMSGLYVDGATLAVPPTNVFAKHCDFTGLSIPLKVTTPVSNLQVVDCPGYNETQTVALTVTTPLSGHVFHASDYGYYGPATIYVAANSGVTAVKINGVTTGAKTGAFFLTAGQSGEIDYGLVAPGFVMIGQ